LSLPVISVDNVDSSTVRLCWREASFESINAYKSNIRERLKFIDIPLEAIMCDDSHCSLHADELFHYCDRVEAILINAGKTCIPKTKPCRTRTPGWNDRVRPYREESLFWHWVWGQCGRPTTGWVSQIRRYTKAQYRRAYRKVHKDQQHIVAEKTANSLNHNNSRDLWIETKNLIIQENPHHLTLMGRSVIHV
jgi:hypothetical protein